MKKWRIGMWMVMAMVMVIFGGCARKDTKEIPIYIAEGIRKVSIVKGGEEVLQISYEPQDYENSYKYWKIRVPYGEEAIVDTEEMLYVYHNMESLDFANASVLPVEEEMGIEQSETMIAVEFCKTTPEERMMVISEEEYDKTGSNSYKKEADSGYTLIIGNRNGEGFYYTALKSDMEQVMLMPEDAIDSILHAEPFDLILKIGGTADIETVERITIDMDYTSYVITAGGEKYQFNDEELTESEYRTLFADLLSILVVNEINGENPRSDKVLLRLFFERSIEDAENLELIYYEYDDEYALVQVNGVEKLLVKKTDVEELKAKVRNL